MIQQFLCLIYSQKCLKSISPINFWNSSAEVFFPIDATTTVESIVTGNTQIAFMSARPAVSPERSDGRNSCLWQNDRSFQAGLMLMIDLTRFDWSDILGKERS